jgi:hypothetical protein
MLSARFLLLPTQITLNKWMMRGNTAAFCAASHWSSRGGCVSCFMLVAGEGWSLSRRAFVQAGFGSLPEPASLFPEAPLTAGAFYAGRAVRQEQSSQFESGRSAAALATVQFSVAGAIRRRVAFPAVQPLSGSAGLAARNAYALDATECAARRRIIRSPWVAASSVFR